jgi:hypothetical protein
MVNNQMTGTKVLNVFVFIGLLLMAFISPSTAMAVTLAHIWFTIAKDSVRTRVKDQNEPTN